MLDAGYFPAKLAVVGLGRLMPDELRLGVRVLAFAQAGEVLRADGSRKAPLSGKPALPLAMALLVAAPVALLTRSKLPRVVRPRLACREWLRDGKHDVRLGCINQPTWICPKRMAPSASRRALAQAAARPGALPARLSSSDLESMMCASVVSINPLGFVPNVWLLRLRGGRWRKRRRGLGRCRRDCLFWRWRSGGGGGRGCPRLLAPAGGAR